MEAFITALDIFEGIDFVDIAPTDLQNATDVMDDVVLATAALEVRANSLNESFIDMNTKALAGEYGLFEEPAIQMAENFLEFDPVSNTRNLNYLAKGLSSLFKGIIALQMVNTAVDELILEYEAMEAAMPEEINASTVVAAVIVVNNGIIGINNSIENAKNNLTIAGNYLNQTASNFSQITGEMVQLQDTATYIDAIVADIGLITDAVTQIQDDIIALKAAAESPDVDGANVIAALEALAYDLDESNDAPTSAMYDIYAAIADIDVQLSLITVES